MLSAVPEKHSIINCQDDHLSSHLLYLLSDGGRHYVDQWPRPGLEMGQEARPRPPLPASSLPEQPLIHVEAELAEQEHTACSPHEPSDNYFINRHLNIF